MYSLDVSGIQDFVFTIQSKDALKTLRARSFYLEMLVEHLSDTLLSKIGLSRANLLYSGGGHFYMLLPNTQQAKTCITEFEGETNAELIRMFSTKLFVAGASAPCSASTLKNNPEGSYGSIFRELSSVVSRRKLCRYSADDIRYLNGQQNHGRECAVCKTVSEQVSEVNQLCPTCKRLISFSKRIQDDRFFVVSEDDKDATPNDALPLPGGKCLSSASKDDAVREAVARESSILRVYSKNEFYQGRYFSTKLWIGDYYAERDVGAYASRTKGVGIERLGALRMDVDDLSRAFVMGFAQDSATYNTLSRTASFSRMMSLFFKRSINHILQHGEENILTAKPSGCPRRATVIYSGGDDAFLIGSWDDIIELAIDLREALRRFSAGKLSVSAGIGIFEERYPVHLMAEETGSLEDCAKDLPGKDAVALLDHDSVYKWDVFIEQVLKEKYRQIQEFFDSSDERGMAFLYHLLGLIREKKSEIDRARSAGRKAGKTISFARWAYLLARMEPEGETADKEKYRRFAQRFYEWFEDEEACRQLVTAMYLYVYSRRGSA
jgi:CRISPR-associated protein Csm1